VCVDGMESLLSGSSTAIFQERKLAEEERIRKEKEMDYLAPFLARIGDPPELTRRDMEEVAGVRTPATLTGSL